MEKGVGKLTKKQFTIHTKEENWETEDGIFTRYRHFLCNDGNIVIELNSHINNCWDFADMLNNLHKENNGDEVINNCENEELEE